MTKLALKLNNFKALKFYLICCEYLLISTLVEFQNQAHDAKEVTATQLYRLRNHHLNKGSIFKNFVYGKGVLFLSYGFFFCLPNSSFIIHHSHLFLLFYTQPRFTKAFSQSFYSLKNISLVFATRLIKSKDKYDCRMPQHMPWQSLSAALVFNSVTTKST